MRADRFDKTLTWLGILFGGANILFWLSAVAIGLLNRYGTVALFTDAGALIGITFSLVGMLVAYHRPRHMMGWVYLMIALSQGFGFFAYQYARYALITHPGSLPFANPLSVLSQVSWAPGLALMLTYALLLFPNGKVPSPGWRFLSWLSLAPLLIYPVLIFNLWKKGGRTFLEHPEQFTTPGNAILTIAYSVFFPLMLLCGFLSVVSLVYRYNKSQGIERAQIKWFTLAAVFTFAGVLLSNFIPGSELNALLNILVVSAIPLAAGMAILRHRLFDIDLIIRRTLLYGAVTALLAVVYFGSVLLLQELFRSLTGQNSPAAIVISTLLISALFNPLRKSLQQAIDRRFFRQPYDVESTLAGFSAQVRNSVDINHLSDSLLSAVQNTLQPDMALLWLRKTSRRS